MAKGIKLFLLCVLLGSLSSCSLAGDDKEKVVEREGPLIPLDVGSTWTFKQRRDANGETRRYSARLSEKREIAGNTYYQFLIKYADSERKTQFFRDSTAGAVRTGTISLYYVEERSYQESTFFKYPVHDDESYEYTDVRGQTFVYDVEREVVETPAGRFRAYTYSGYDGDPEVSISFAPGIGPVRLTQSDGETVLASYDE